MNIIDIPQSMLDLLALRIDGDEPWSDPEELQFDLEPVAPFERNLLPEVLANFVMDAAHRMQCPPDFVAVSCLTMIGSVIGAACSVHPKKLDDWSEVPNLWGGIVGRPGALKTPAISAGMAPLSWIEGDAQRTYEEDMNRFLMRKVDRATELKQLKSDNAHTKLQISPEEVRQRIVQVTLAEQTDKEPTLTRFRTNDATVEKIGELARDSPRGLLYIRDELVGLLASCDKQGHEGDRAFFLEAWVGRNSMSVDRIGRGSIVVARLCLSLFGGIQPAKLQDYIYGTVMGYDNDGLLQRFQLMVFPDEFGDWKYVDQKPDSEAKNKVIDILRKLASTDFVSMGATQEDEHDIPHFHFCDSAQKLFVKWLTQLEVDVRKIESPVLAEHIGKYRKLIPALALIFHLVDLASGVKPARKGISREALQRAIAWGDYLSSHADRIYSLALDQVQSAISALSAKLKSGSLADGFSERDVYKSGWSHLKDAQTVHAACAELELDGWIRRIQAERGAGRPQSPSYNINPALKPK